MTGAKTAHPSFAVPILTEETTLGFKLVVHDAQDLFATATVGVTIGPNHPPVANAGADVWHSGLEPVVLLGRGSDGDVDSVLSLDWRQIGGTALTLTPDPGCAACRSFTAPLSVTDETLVFELKATDPEGAAGKDTLEVFIRANTAPIVDLGPDQGATPGTLATLNANITSYEPEVLQYAWRQLSVTDPQGASSTDTVRITVNRNVVGGDARAPRSTLTRLSDGTRRITVNETAIIYAQIVNARPWWVYHAPFSVRKGEIVEYYAVDRAGNRETLRRYVTP